MTSAGVVDIIKAIVNPSSERALQDAEDRKTKDSLKLRWSNGPASSARENNSTGDTAGNNASNQNVEPRQNNRKGGKRRGRMDPNRVKVGHGGTLDPDATGVLVIGLGDGCKSMKEYLAGDKVYLAEGTLGYATDTYDESGQRTAEAPCDHVTESDFSNALSAFIGDIEQVPPMYSALKVKGKKLYELAFEGKTVERKARPVTCYDIELIEFDQPNFTIRVRCGGGFYIRSLIYDIGRKLDTYAVMTDLRRTKQGQFELDSYLTLMQPQEKWGLELIMQKLAQSNEKLAQKQVEREAGKKKEDRKGGEGE